ncbi:hypothetical protein AKJ16_DCAP09365 [Drosera capensis]
MLSSLVDTKQSEGSLYHLAGWLAKCSTSGNNIRNETRVPACNGSGDSEYMKFTASGEKVVNFRSPSLAGTHEVVHGAGWPMASASYGLNSWFNTWLFDEVLTTYQEYYEWKAMVSRFKKRPDFGHFQVNPEPMETAADGDCNASWSSLTSACQGNVIPPASTSIQVKGIGASVYPAMREILTRSGLHS